MVLPSGFAIHARHGDGPDCRHDRSTPSAPDSSAYARGWVSAGLIWLVLACAAAADPLRIAVFHTDLERSGPGLLLRDILRGEDEQVAAVVDTIAAVDPDILLLLGFDYDAGLVALAALADRLDIAGSPYPHRFALRPNAGWPTGVDIDGDGTWPEPQDAHGYGRFNGEGGMALLSRFEIANTDARDFSSFLWRDLPFGQSQTVLSDEAAEVLRLSTMGIWDVPVITGPDTRFHLLAIHAGPPVFDGPEDRNGIRNEDETSFFLRYLNGWSPDGQPFGAEAFAVLGTLNVDPDRGEGRSGAVTALLSHPLLQDPVPRDPDGRAATSNWDEPSPGRLRVDYILPAAGLEVTGAGIHGLPDDTTVTAASGHRLVWVDIDLPD